MRYCGFSIHYRTFISFCEPFQGVYGHFQVIEPAEMHRLPPPVAGRGAVLAIARARDARRQWNGRSFPLRDDPPFRVVMFHVVAPTEPSDLKRVVIIIMMRLRDAALAADFAWLARQLSRLDGISHQPAGTVLEVLWRLHADAGGGGAPGFPAPARCCSSR